MDTAIAVTVATVVVLAYLAATVFACVQVWRSIQLTELEKYVWIAAIILVPFLAALIWGLAGPHPFGLRLPELPKGTLRGSSFPSDHARTADRK